MPFIWLGAVVLFLLLEGLTTALTSVWFAAGALAALVAAMLGAPAVWQLVVFVTLSAATLLLIRPLTARVFKIGRERTNADRLIGTEGIVLHEIDNTAGHGEVQVSGQIWSARAHSGESIPAGCRVHIRSIQGVRLQVERVQEREEEA